MRCESQFQATDVAVNASSGIACPVWAPIKYVLKLSKDHLDALEHILRMIDTVSGCLPRLRIYQRLNSHPALQTAFLRLFTTIIDFSIVTLRYLNRNAFSRAIRHVGRKLESEFGNVMDRLKRQAKGIDGTAIAIELERASQYRRKIERTYHHDLRIRCSDWLQAPNVHEDLGRQLEKRLAGTCQWILTDPKFTAWSSTSGHSDSDVNKLLLICGNPGCGKTVLAASIVEHVKSQTKNTLFFPFSFIDETRQDIKVLVRSLIWQALVAIDKQECWDTIHVLMSKGTVILSEFWGALESILKHDHGPWFLIIDGVDECNELDQLICDQIPGLLQSGVQLRIVLLGRPQILQHRQALPSSSLLQITPAMVRGDIDAYVSDMVHTSSLLRAHRSKDQVIKSLQKQSEGMFLWARLMIQDLHNSSSPAEVCHRLDNLPKGLAEAYERVFRHLHDALGNDALRIGLVRSVLAFAAMSRRPLSFQELRHALALNAKLRLGYSPQPIEDFLPRYSAEQLVGLCGNLIVVSNDRVLLIHPSLKEFLVELPEYSRNHTNLRLDLYLEPKETHRLLARACIKYLQLGNYGLPWQDHSSLPELRSHHAFLEYASKHVLYHISSSTILFPVLIEDIMNFLKSRFCVSWIENFFLDMTDDVFLATVPLDLKRLMAWVFESGREDDVRAEMRKFVETEMERRLRVSDINDPSIQRWSLFASIVNESVLTSPGPLEAPSTISNGPHLLGVKTNIMNARWSAVHLDKLAHRTIGVLVNSNLSKGIVSQLQMDMILTIANISATGKKITGAMEQLFRLLLEKADCVPVYALWQIALFYHKIGKKEHAIQFCHSALKKVEGSETWLEFELIELLADIYFQVAICKRIASRFKQLATGFEQSVPYYERAAAGKLRLRGKVNPEIANIKYNLAMALLLSNRPKAECEAHFRELLDDKKLSHFLNRWQIFAIYVRIGGCRYLDNSSEDAMAWLQRALAMNLPWVQGRLSMGALLCVTGQYDRALPWFEEAIQSEQRKTNESKSWRRHRMYWHGYTLYNLRRWDESFALLYQAIAEDAPDSIVDPSPFHITTLEDVISALFYLGDQYLSSRAYACSLKCFQLVAKESRNASNLQIDWVMDSTINAGLSLYGLGKFNQGLALLRSIEDDFLESCEQRIEEKDIGLLELKYLIGLGLEQESLSAVSATQNTAPQTISSFGSKRRRSFEDLQQSGNQRSQDHDWRYMIGLTERTCDELEDLRFRVT